MFKFEHHFHASTLQSLWPDLLQLCKMWLTSIFISAGNNNSGHIKLLSFSHNCKKTELWEDWFQNVFSHNEHMQMSQQKKQKSCWSHPFIAFLRAANNNSLLLLQKKKKDTMILPTRKSNKSKPLSCRIVDNKSEVSWLCQYRATEELNILTLLC